MRSATKANKMTQVWMIRNSDTDIHLFNRREHCERSIGITYSRCNVQIEQIENSVRRMVFSVKGTRPVQRVGGEDSEPVNDTLTFECWPVWTEPSHL